MEYAPDVKFEINKETEASINATSVLAGFAWQRFQ